MLKSYGIIFLFILIPVIAEAYIGPGLGLGAIGIVVGLIGSLLMAFVTVLYYPFKRVLEALRTPQKKKE